MTKNTQVVKEDTQNIYNKWVSGIAKREAPPDVVTIDDLINRFRNNSNYSAPKVLPFPLDLLLDRLGDIFTKVAETRFSLVKSIDRTPIINKSKSKIKAVERLNQKMNEIQKIIYSCTEELNVLVEKDKEDSNIS